MTEEKEKSLWDQAREIQAKYVKRWLDGGPPAPETIDIHSHLQNERNARRAIRSDCS